MLCRDVGRLVRRALQADRGCGHDDPAARLAGQVRPGELHRQERALDHKVHQPVPVGLGVAGDRVHRLRSRVQDQNIEPAVPLQRRLDRRPVALGRRHVGDQAVIAVHVHRHNRGAGAAQRLHGCAAQATRCPRQHRDTPGERAASTAAGEGSSLAPRLMCHLVTSLTQDRW